MSATSFIFVIAQGCQVCVIKCPNEQHNESSANIQSTPFQTIHKDYHIMAITAEPMIIFAPYMLCAFGSKLLVNNWKDVICVWIDSDSFALYFICLGSVSVSTYLCAPDSE